MNDSDTRNRLTTDTMTLNEAVTAAREGTLAGRLTATTHLHTSVKMTMVSVASYLQVNERQGKVVALKTSHYENY